MPSLCIAVGIFQIQKEYQEIPLAPSVLGCKSNDLEVGGTGEPESPAAGGQAECPSNPPLCLGPGRAGPS